MIAVYVAIGGAIGSVLRYLLMGRISVLLGHSDFPYGTMVVNILGSLLMGVLIEVLSKANIAISQEIRAFIAVGILGGFTTFSSFSLDVMTLIEKGNPFPALLYVLVSVLCALLGIFAGMYMMRWVW